MFIGWCVDCLFENGEVGGGGGGGMEREIGKGGGEGMEREKMNEMRRREGSGGLKLNGSMDILNIGLTRREIE